VAPVGPSLAFIPGPASPGSGLLEAEPGTAREVTSRLYEAPPGWLSTQDPETTSEDPSPQDPEAPPEAD
jgi:hypothetical protein